MLLLKQDITSKDSAKLFGKQRDVPKNVTQARDRERAAMSPYLSSTRDGGADLRSRTTSSHPCPVSTMGLVSAMGPVSTWSFSDVKHVETTQIHGAGGRSAGPGPV